MRRLLPVLALTAFSLAACGKGDTPAASDTSGAPAPAADASGLTPAQIENGIGPITTVAVSETIDPALVAQGETLFTQKCSACHKLDERYVGPPLRDVTTRRAPAFVMNQMLNPAEMAQKHPEGKKLLAEFLTQMPDQQLTEADARALLEYLRKAATEAPAAAPAP